MRVSRYAGPAEPWDRFVESWPGATYCHLFGWKRVIEQCLGHQSLYLAAEQDGCLVGVLPLIWVRSRLFGRYLVSVPFLNYGGPIGTEEAMRALALEAASEARKGAAHLLELRCRDELSLDLPVSHRKLTVLLDLPCTGEDLWRAFPSKLRSQIRRPQKEGVTVRFGADQVAPFYEVLSTHMRDLGTPVQSERLFREIAQVFADSVLFVTAWLGDIPVACGAGFRFGDEFEITWASALRTQNRIAPNMLVYFSLMERCVREGVRIFNFGRCTPGSGSHRFKMQWGGREHPLWWYSNRDSRVSATPNPDDETYAWGPRIWKKLPVPLATRAGPYIARLIP